MKLSRAFSIALLTALVLPAGGLFLSAPSARAADGSSPADPPSCAITADDLAGVKAAAAQGLLAELSARRALLTRTITCAQNDAQALKKQLNGTSLDGLTPDRASGARTIQSRLSEKLDGATTYYGLELAKVHDAGIAGTRSIAKEVLSWRAANYEPLAGNVENFSLWVSSQPLFSAAADRLNGIASLVSFFEQAGPNGELQADLTAAQTLMQTAKNENGVAENALLQSLPPDQVRAQIQQSLEPLSETYQKFFNIADAIKKLLPAAPGK